MLILVGSIVRSTGAGMGCPDWPKCFGSYVPPTSAEQLPSNYLETFKTQRLKKNTRLAGTLKSLGYNDLASKILSDPFIQREQEFNVTKAWIEYVNRLVGVLIGFLVFLNMIFSFNVRKTSKWIPIVAVFTFVLTGFQGWVGSLVVSTNLLEGFITFHMLLALLIVALLIWMNVRIQEITVVKDRQLFLLSVGLFILFVPQVIMGIEVRGDVDQLLVSEIERTGWTQHLSDIFAFHRSYSWLILVGSAVICYLCWKRGFSKLFRTSRYLLGMVIAIGIVGFTMTQFDFPFWSQPLHLILATGIFSVLFYLILRLKPV